MEETTERSHKKIAYVRRSMWSFHNGNRGYNVRLVDEDGKFIADVPEEFQGAARENGLKVFAAMCGYDDVVDGHCVSLSEE